MRRAFPELTFMWCAGVNQDDNFMPCYPGNDQVEYLSFDGYNHSTSHGGWSRYFTSPWLPYAQLPE